MEVYRTGQNQSHKGEKQCDPNGLIKDFVLGGRFKPGIRDTGISFQASLIPIQCSARQARRKKHVPLRGGGATVLRKTPGSGW